MNSINEIPLQNASECLFCLYYTFGRYLLRNYEKTGEETLRQVVKSFAKKQAESIISCFNEQNCNRNLKNLFSNALPCCDDPRVFAECQGLTEETAIYTVHSCPFSKAAKNTQDHWIGQIYCEEYLLALLNAFSFATAKVSISDCLCNTEDDHCRIAVYLRAANMNAAERNACFAPDKTIDFETSAYCENTNIQKAVHLCMSMYEICAETFGVLESCKVMEQCLKEASEKSSQFVRMQAEKCGAVPDEPYLLKNSVFGTSIMDEVLSEIVETYYVFH